MYSGLQSMLHFEILAACIRVKKTGSRLARVTYSWCVASVVTETESAVQWIERFSSGLTRQLKGKRPTTKVQLFRAFCSQSETTNQTWPARM